MAENDLDGGNPAGTAGSPTSQSSSGGSDSNSSFDAGKLQSLIEGFGKRIDEIDSRTKSLQGDKDRAVVKTKKEVEELKAKIAEYEKLKSKGLAPDEALDEMDFRSTVRQLQDQLGKLGSVPAQSAGNGAGGADATARVLQAAQLDANTPEVLDLIRQFGNDPVTLAVRAGELRAKAANKPTPDAASSPTPSAPPSSSQAVDVSALSAEYSRLVKEPGKNWQRIKEIEEKLNKA
jgi:hypothetical protein